MSMTLHYSTLWCHKGTVLRKFVHMQKPVWIQNILKYYSKWIKGKNGLESWKIGKQLSWHCFFLFILIKVCAFRAQCAN